MASDHHHPERLRVAVDAGPLYGTPTGVGNFCAGLLEALALVPTVDVSGYAVTWRKRQNLRTLMPPGVRFRARRLPARPLHRAWQRGNWPPLDRLIGNADVVHGTNFVVPPTARAARVVTVHDLTCVRFPELCDVATLRYPDSIRRALADGAWVHTPSRFVAGEVVEHFGADPARVTAISSGLPTFAEVDDGEDRETLVFARYILAIGTVEPRKGYPSLVAAFDRLAGDRPDLGLVIAGAAGWGSEAVDEAVGLSPQRGRIVQTGYASSGRVGRLLRGAAVLAYPSKYEGFGYPPLQAMAAGVPVVTTDAGALPDTVGDAATLVPVGDVDALAGALGRLLDDPDQAAAQVAEGHRHAAKFTWQQCAADMARLYDRAAVAPG